MLLGSLVNGAAILAGSAVGLFLRFILRRSSCTGERKSTIGERLQKIVMQGLALCTMYIGISGALKGQNTLIAILSLVIGAVIGELLDLDGAMNRAGNWVQKKVSRPGSEGDTLQIHFAVEKGSIKRSITAPDGAVLYTGNGMEATDFTVNIPADGIYAISVEARQAAGSLHIQQTAK